jgi:hypothetical protein
VKGEIRGPEPKSQSRSCAKKKPRATQRTSSVGIYNLPATGVRPADWKSAIQQIGNLRYDQRECRQQVAIPKIFAARDDWEIALQKRSPEAFEASGQPPNRGTIT